MSSNLASTYFSGSRTLTLWRVPSSSTRVTDAFAFVDSEAALLGEIQLVISWLAGIGDDDIRPADPGRHFPHVNDEIRKAVVEHARLNLAFPARHEQPERNFAERLICRRKRDNHDVGRRRGREHGEQNQADAAAARD